MIFLYRPLKKLLELHSSAKIKNILWISVVVSFIISVASVYRVDGVSFATGARRILIFYFPTVYMNITPILLVFRRGIIKKIKEKPIYAIFLILYFLLFVPIFLGIHFNGTGNLASDEKGFFYMLIMLLNFLSLIICHVILIKYVFFDIVFKKRRSTGQDILIIPLSYISIGVSFGFVYAAITTMSYGPAFQGMDLSMVSEMGSLKLYMRHIYFSFITITSVGYGDIFPITWPAQMVAILESVMGIFLLSFSLGMILNSEAKDEDENQSRCDENLKEDLIRDIEKIIDEKLNKNNRE